jgi:hypothetical protein
MPSNGGPQVTCQSAHLLGRFDVPRKQNETPRLRRFKKDTFGL